MTLVHRSATWWRWRWREEAVLKKLRCQLGPRVLIKRFQMAGSKCLDAPSILSDGLRVL
jgi:hypothetical protein